MKYQKLRQLIDKYFDGKTTLAEEHEIKNIFKSTKDLPADLQDLKPYFAYLVNASGEKSTRTLKFEEKKRKIIPLRVLRYVAAAAAVILITFSIFKQREEKIVYAYINGKAITDKELAKQEAIKALSEVSDNWNNGVKQLRHLDNFYKAENMIKNKNEKF